MLLQIRQNLWVCCPELKGVSDDEGYENLKEGIIESDDSK